MSISAINKWSRTAGKYGKGTRITHVYIWLLLLHNTVSNNLDYCDSSTIYLENLYDDLYRVGRFYCLTKTEIAKKLTKNCPALKNNVVHSSLAICSSIDENRPVNTLLLSKMSSIHLLINKNYRHKSVILYFVQE